MKSGYDHVKAWRAKQDPEALKAKRREEGRKYRKKYAAKLRAYQDSWREENVDLHRAQDAALHRKKRRLDPEGNRRRLAKFRAKQERLLINLAGRGRPSHCELCGHKGKTVFDHCHSSGQFRGWLCQRCNRTLGQVKDNVELLQKMINYLHGGGLGYGSVEHVAERVSAQIGLCDPIEGAEVGQLPN